MKQEKAMTKLVMLGDSVFDNSAYVNPGEPDVGQQVLARLKAGDTRTGLTFFAEDGAVIRDVKELQIRLVPGDATHIVLSVGGNDLLGLMGRLGMRHGNTFGENLRFLSGLKSRFAEEYSELLRMVDALGLPFAVCSIYYAAYQHFAAGERVELQEGIEWEGTDIAVDAFDAAITASADECENCREVIDLRLVCNSPECYANPIEPSRVGGERIADQVLWFVRG